jgi:D-lactate dehydrogenase (cytochrome)
VKGSQEKKSPIPLEDLKTGPTIVLDFGANMNEIVEVHERDLDVVVQPGMPYEQLNEELKAKGLFFPVDVSSWSFKQNLPDGLISYAAFMFQPGPGAEIGGMVGTGCSGTNGARTVHFHSMLG